MILSARAFAPFQFRNYRFQFPADLAASWAFEMEQIALGWYVLTETGSVTLLTLYVALQLLGAALAPVFGALGDRIGHRNLQLGIRTFFGLLALTILTLSFSGLLRPLYVLIIAGMFGLVRSSDVVMRNALIGMTMPPGVLMAAMSTQRVTMDSARIAGALSGAGLVAAVGLGPAYIAITGAYAVSTLLVFGISQPEMADTRARPARTEQFSPWRDLKLAFTYIREAPYMVATLLFALLVNLTLFPLLGGLLAYVAKDVYHVDQAALGYLVASYAVGSLLGSLAISQVGARFRPGRMMIISAAVWHVIMLVFAQIDQLAAGVAMLFVIGMLQSATMIPMSVVLLRNMDSQFRGRVLGVRSLVVYSLPLGVLIAGPLIEGVGFVATVSLYAVVGGVATLAIAVIWRDHIWQRDADANAR